MPLLARKFRQHFAQAFERIAMATRRRSPYLFAFFLLVAIAATTSWCVRSLGRWLMVQDPLGPAAAITVLSGRLPTRAREAADLYRKGFASQVWLTRPVGPGEELAELGIPYVREEIYNQRVLIRLGVPEGAIRILETAIVNTSDEVDVIAKEAAREGVRKLIIVTTKAHTRRVRAIWRKKLGDSPRMIVRYASTDDFDPDHWWRHNRDALDVLREVLGLANTWAGFPVKPAP